MAADAVFAKFPLPERPRLRSVEITPFEHEEKEWLHLNDRAGYAPDIQVPRALAPLLGLMDGRFDAESITRMAQAHYGEELNQAFVEQLISELDELLLLESPRFHARRSAVEAEFIDSPVRPSAFAGKSYPLDPGKLRAYMDDLRRRGEELLPTPGLRAFDVADVQAIVVPHIDFGRGGKEEALAYLPLVENVRATGKPFDTLITFGIAHCGVEYPYCAAAKDYETPLGTVPCDREFLADLQTRLDARLTAEQYAHKGEHSIEFVADFLQYYPELASTAIVPILCGGFWEPLRGKYSPLEDPDIGAFVHALREVTAKHEAAGKKIGFIASVDGAHVGSNFGDRTPLTETKLKQIEYADRQWCAAIEAGDAEALHAHFTKDANQYNVDAHPAVYTLLAAFPQLRAQLLTYNQAYDAGANSVVSFATLVLFGVD